MREFLSRLDVACRFLARVFHAPPAAGFIEELAAERLIDDWPLGSSGEDTRTGVRLMSAFCASWTAPLLAELEGDFNRLFVGPGSPLAPPWESYYLSRDHLLFQEQTLAVRQTYSDFGLEAPHRGQEPDDSLGLELYFLAELCSRFGTACETGPPEAQREVLEAIRRFLAEHVLRWAPSCLRLVIERAKLDYYRAAAFLALGCLRETSRVFGFESGCEGEAGESQDGSRRSAARSRRPD